jgi:hypothetical protein
MSKLLGGFSGPKKVSSLIIQGLLQSQQANVRKVKLIEDRMTLPAGNKPGISFLIQLKKLYILL